MKKKINNSLIIIFLLTILLIIIFLVYYLIKSTYSIKIGIVVEKNDKKIFIKNSTDSTIISYELNLKENSSSFYDVEGKKIDFSNLNIGDKIKVTYKKKEMLDLVNSFPTIIKDIKSVQVIDNNVDKHLTEEDLMYNYFYIKFTNPSDGKLSFIIDSINFEKFSTEGLTMKIVKKINNNKPENIEIKQFESSEISYSEYIDNMLKIVVNNFNFTELERGLEKGEYIISIQNSKAEIIKIPFEINSLGNLQWKI